MSGGAFVIRFRADALEEFEGMAADDFHAAVIGPSEPARYHPAEMMVGADRFLPPPAELTGYVFNFYDWDTRQPRYGQRAATQSPPA